MIRINFAKVEILTISTLLILGIYAVLVTPFSAGFDEETHLLRVWQISNFSFIPNEKVGNDLPYPAIYHELSYRREALIHPVDPDFWAKYGSLELDAFDYIYTEKTTRSVYSPVLLLPQSLVMRYAGRAWNWPALPVFYLSRIIGLLSYTLLAWGAVRTIPYGKWLLAILAMSPMAIFQAATISADSISNGIGFFFVAGVLAILTKDKIGLKSWLALIGLIALLFTAKVNTALLVVLPLTILKPSHFKLRWGYFLLIGSIAILGLVEVMGWNILAYANYDRALEGADPLGQLGYLIGHPFQFIQIFIADIWQHGGEYFLEWVGVYGHNYWSVPKITYILYPLAVLGAYFIPGANIPSTKRTRIGLGITFGLNFLAVLGLLYITFTPVGSLTISGVQGRYFTLVAPLFFLATYGLTAPKKWQIKTWIPVSLVVGSLITYLGGLYLVYHVNCGTKYYEAGLCYQPYYKNWAPNDLYSAPISPEFSLTQEIIAECEDLTQLRLWVDPTEAHQNSATNIVLRDPAMNRILFDEDIPAEKIHEKGWLSLDFHPDPDSSGKTYLLTIENGKASKGQGFRVAYTLKPEYMLGKLYENGEKVSNDLVFQYGCLTGLEKLLSSRTP